MTRASLLHILDHVDRISDAEVRELEQLATTFPYCQTAHVLLAKAAHDRSSMLASQRLRRAATYAADRELLRQLLEQPAALISLAPMQAPAFEETSPTRELAVATVAAAIPTVLPSHNFTPSLVPTELASPPAPEALEPIVIAESDSEALEVQTEVSLTEDVALSTEPVEAVVLAPSSFEETAFEYHEHDDAVLATDADNISTHETAEIEDASVGVLPLPEQPSIESPTSNTAEEPSLDLSIAASEYPPAVGIETEVASEQTPEEVGLDDDFLPAVAPPIRPPVEAGISRFEFGLSQPALPEPSSYQLPGLEQEITTEESTEQEEAPVPLVTAPFQADEDLGYALGAGSRLGYDLQPHDGFTLDLPLESFFAPDALLLAHMAAHRPKPKPSSLDLINRFLKNQPRIKSPAGVPLPAEEQTDLSVRGTITAPALASESLAKIMVRQGKKEKAIEIYERLMERQPEKKAYFSEQIQQLQQSPE